MSEVIGLRVVSLTGTTKELTIDRFNSVRSIESLAEISTPENSRLIFMLGSRVLLPDLSLAHQEVSNGDTIRVLCKRKSKESHRNPFTAEINQRQQRIEKMNRELYKESIRLSDISFLPYEGAKSREKLFFQMPESSETDTEFVLEHTTNIQHETSKQVGKHALPICWEEEVYDRSAIPPCFSPSIKRQYATPKDNSIIF